MPVWYLNVDIFSLDQVFLLWDNLITGPPNFCLLLGVAILKQLNDQILSSDFSKAMLLFSELPVISLDNMLYNAYEMVLYTPPSLFNSINSLDPSLGVKTPDSTQRFSFLSKDYCIGQISNGDFEEIQALATIFDPRPPTVKHMPGVVFIEKVSFGVTMLAKRGTFVIIIDHENAQELAMSFLSEKLRHVAVLANPYQYDSCNCEPLPQNGTLLCQGFKQL